MAYSAKILADSVSPAGVRLTTLEVTFPRLILAEFNTHRMLSRSSASSRAIPVAKRIEAVRRDPFIPDVFGKNKTGMRADENLEVTESHMAQAEWIGALKSAIAYAEELAAMGVHKQLANRLLEPFVWHTVIVTATEWDNFFALRCHPDAQPEFQKTARLMREAMDVSEPKRLGYGEWHRPFCDDVALLRASGFDEDEINLIAIGRCARVSYMTHDGRRDPRADIDLSRKLLASGHMSPFEHVACFMSNIHSAEFSGNFRGWKQYRKFIPNEQNFGAIQVAR